MSPRFFPEGFSFPSALPFFVLVKERRNEAKQGEGRLVGQLKRIEMEEKKKGGEKKNHRIDGPGSSYLGRLRLCLSVMMAAMDAESCLRICVGMLKDGVESIELLLMLIKGRTADMHKV